MFLVVELYGKGGLRMNLGVVRNLWVVWEGDFFWYLGYKFVGGGD